MKKIVYWKIALALAFLVIFAYATVRFIAGIPQDNGLNSLPELNIPQNLGIKTDSPLGGKVTFESDGVHFDDLAGLGDARRRENRVLDEWLGQLSHQDSAPNGLEYSPNVIE